MGVPGWNGHFMDLTNATNGSCGTNYRSTSLPLLKIDNHGLHPMTDMSAAAHADVLFVKLKENGESDLAKYCDNHGIPHILFNNFGEALDVVQSVVQGTESVQGAQAITDIRKTTAKAT